MDEKDQKIAELENTVAMLRRKLYEANQKILSMQRNLRRQYRFTQDYVPYADEEEGR